MDVSQLSQAICEATRVTHDPGATPQRRAEAVQFFEQLKQGEIHSTVHAAAYLTDAQQPLEVQLTAYTLLHLLVRNRWAELSQDEQQKILQLAYQHMKDVGHLGQQAAWPLKSKAAMLLAAVTRQQGPETYTALLPQLVASAAEGPMQAEISCMVLQFVSEDITQFEERGGDWRRNYLAALSASCEMALPFLVTLLKDSLQAGTNAASAGRGDEARAHAAVVSAALGTLTGFVEWAPLARLGSTGVVDACGFFMGVPDFRGAALGVLKQLLGRRAAAKDVEESAALAATMAKVADALANAAAGLLAGPNAQQELGLEGVNEEAGRQLCGLMTALADTHWGHVDGVTKQHTLLHHMLGFLRHPHLPLASAAAAFWAVLVREAGGGPTIVKPSPLQSPRDTSSGDGAGSQQQQQQQLSQEAAAAAAQQQHHQQQLVPTECCQMLVQALTEQLVRLPVRFEDVEVPLWAEDGEDFKAAVVGFRTQGKLIMRAAAKLAPAPVLSCVGPLQQQCLSVASGADSAAAAAVAAGGVTGALPPAALAQLQQGTMALEAAVVLLEAVLPSLLDALPSEGPGFRDGTNALLQPLLPLRYIDPVMISLHARALEAFSRLLAHVPDRVVPLLMTSFECMAAVPLEQNGQLPPPATVSLRWKEEAMARISMSKVLLNVAKESPACLLPHLQALVQKVEALWAGGQLREGEKVALHEGLMVAVSRAGSLELQTQLLEWLLRPIHAKWTDPRWLAHLESPAAFAAEYMQHEVQQGGTVVVGSSQQRWSLHHELQLFERILRRTPAPTAAAAAAAGQPQQQLQQPLQQQQQQQHPFAPHAEWSLMPIAAMVRCMHGLATPDMQAQLSALRPAFTMDPVEKALRMGGAREDAKKLEEEPGTIAGANLPALRHWLKAIRDSTYFTLHFAAAHLGPTLWYNQRLAGAVPASLVVELDAMEDRHLKLLLRHAVTAFLVHCPQPVRPPWLLPVLSRLLPSMQARLTSKWAAVAAAAAGGGAGSGGLAPGGSQQAAAAAAQQQLSEEVVGETLLRETSREYMTMMTKMVERGLPAGAAAAAAGGGAASTAAAAASPAAAAAAAALSGPPPPEQESVVESVWKYDEGAVRALMATAVAGMCWPDTQAAARATVVCKFVASLAEGSHPELEALVLPDMLRSAMLSVVQVSTINIQTEVLQLQRQILAAWLPRSELIRGVLLQLPHVTPQVLASFQQQLLSLNSEKDQRNLIKSLLAEAGGEQARSVLAAVSKVAAPITNASQAKARAPGASEADEIRWDWSEAGIAL